MESGIEQDIKRLWKTNKILFIVIVGGIAAVIYLVYKNGTNAFVATTTGTVASPTGTDAAGLSPAISNSYTSLTYTGIPVPIAPKPGGPRPTPPPPPIAVGPNPPPQPPPPNQPPPTRVQTIFPAPKGSLKWPQAAGNNDTNWWSYTVGPNQTLGQLAKSYKIGNGDPSYLVNYRNNRDIFNQMGIDVSNTNAPVLPGWIISV
jgi:hypothetical protein